MNIDAEKIATLIDLEFKDMRKFPPMESTGFAIFECNGIQVQVNLTKNEDDFISEVQEGIVAV